MQGLFAILPATRRFALCVMQLPQRLAAISLCTAGRETGSNVREFFTDGRGSTDRPGISHALSSDRRPPTLWHEFGRCIGATPCLDNSAVSTALPKLSRLSSRRPAIQRHWRILSAPGGAWTTRRGPTGPCRSLSAIYRRIYDRRFENGRATARTLRPAAWNMIKKWTVVFGRATARVSHLDSRGGNIDVYCWL